MTITMVHIRPVLSGAENIGDRPSLELIGCSKAAFPTKMDIQKSNIYGEFTIIKRSNGLVITGQWANDCEIQFVKDINQSGRKHAIIFKQENLNLVMNWIHFHGAINHETVRLSNKVPLRLSGVSTHIRLYPRHFINVRMRLKRLSCAMWRKF